ncbi:MAG: RNase H-like domain-containing protein, partial [bacterium]
LLLTCIRDAGSTKKSSLKKIKFDKGLWSNTHEECFFKCKERIQKQVELQYLKGQDFQTCLFTDASDTHWGVVLTQIPCDDKYKEFENQAHEPLLFLSGTFRGSQLSWSVIEKETWPIM